MIERATVRPPTPESKIPIGRGSMPGRYRSRTTLSARRPQPLAAHAATRPVGTLCRAAKHTTSRGKARTARQGLAQAPRQTPQRPRKGPADGGNPTQLLYPDADTGRGTQWAYVRAEWDYAQSW